ncbi:MAG: peptidylprolyl isomerase [Ruminococcaceae bacterium]|nr:peptidylprolyl isomerase [Oscillospiraceae bacterium]
MENVNIKITVRDFGEMTFELYPEKAPKTVENFTSLIKENFFEGLIFHRIIAGFMIQGGGYDAIMNHKDAPSIKGEFKSNGFPQNDIKHKRGVISMARTMIPDSASSQFFIMHEDAPHLDGEYAAFGAITSGIEVVDAIAGVATSYSDCPITPVVIEKIELI